MEKKSEKMPCCAKVSVKKLIFAHYKPCTYTASVERDGKHYCKRHDPVASEAKKKATFDSNKNLKMAMYIAHLKIKAERKKEKAK